MEPVCWAGQLIWTARYSQSRVSTIVSYIHLLRGTEIETGTSLPHRICVPTPDMTRYDENICESATVIEILIGGHLYIIVVSRLRRPAG